MKQKTTTAPETFTINNKTYYGTYDKAMDKYMERHESEKEMTFTQWYDDFLVPTTAPEVKQDKGNGHTPGEIKISKDGNDIETSRKDSPTGICSMYAYEWADKDAARIVECWNNYDQLKADNKAKDETIRELLEALKLAKDIMTTYKLMNSKAGARIEKAIAKHNQ